MCRIETEPPYTSFGHIPKTLTKKVSGWCCSGYEILEVRLSSMIAKSACQSGWQIKLLWSISKTVLIDMYQTCITIYILYLYSYTHKKYSGRLADSINYSIVFLLYCTSIQLPAFV